MSELYAFSINTTGDEASEIETTLGEALKNVGIAIPHEGICEFEGPPSGAFGFGEGVLKFFSDGWKELMKVPEAVLAIADGLGAYLKNRPNLTITMTKTDGTRVKLKANMKSGDIANVLGQLN